MILLRKGAKATKCLRVILVPVLKDGANKLLYDIDYQIIRPDIHVGVKNITPILSRSGLFEGRSSYCFKNKFQNEISIP